MKTTRLRVLGCAGGIGGPDLRTTALLLDDDVLIDAGTGVQELSLDALAAIDHIFVTHSHLDHVCSIPFMADAIGARRSAPITVYALPATLNSLKAHLFNWEIWPDFTVLPTPQAPVLKFVPLDIGKPIRLGTRVVTALPASHVVPAVGYRIDGAGGQSVVYTGDTGPNPALWDEVNKIGRLSAIIIETAFGNAEAELAAKSLHLSSQTLTKELQSLGQAADIYITHLKPGEADQVMREIRIDAAQWNPKELESGQQIEF